MKSVKLTGTLYKAVAGVAVGLSIATLICCALRNSRRNGTSPAYIPTKFLKGRWKSGRHGYVSTGSADPNTESSAPSATPPRRPPTDVDTGNRSLARDSQASSNVVDRNTSVRSVMTLPPYMPKPSESERVLGREGERGGIDMVIEYPETAEAEELRRDEEMESLYQIRSARRIEAAGRERLRRLRREARERNDWVALEELRSRSRAASGTSAGRSLEELREEHARIRDRARVVSSVSYGDLGVARHDGTRIRANSEESERPLLGDAASIAASTNYHRRDRSASSVLSIDTMGSDFPSPGITRSRANSRPDSTRRISGQAGSIGSSDPAYRGEGQDVADEEIPGYGPPEYENIALEDGQEPPPEYRSPVETRMPEEPSLPTSPILTPVVSRFSIVTQRRDSPTSLEGRATQPPNLRVQGLPSIVVNAATPVNPPIQGGVL